MRDIILGIIVLVVISLFAVSFATWLKICFIVLFKMSF